MATPRDRSRPHWIEWAVVVGSVIIQQNAFVLLPFVLAGESFRGVVNPLNTIAVWASLTSMSILCAWRVRSLARLARQNVASVAFVILVLASTTWSIHPDATIRRGIGYVLTMMVAAFLCVRFDNGARMRALSLAFIISAIASVLFVALFPSYGIMQQHGLAGAWRGVFPHKNVFGPIMASAVFTELYLLADGHGQPRWRFVTLALFCALTLASHSATAALLSLFYVAGACAYVAWRKHPLVVVVAIMDCALVLLIAVIVLWSDPGGALGAVGKDLTLTGRTTLWQVIIEFIREKPMLGWGYHAMWQLNDPTTIYADAVTGHWGVMNAENSFMSITLELGIFGLLVLISLVYAAFARSVRCCLRGVAPLGWFSLMFFLGAIVSAQTTENLGQNQVIAWVLFNVLAFSCGVELKRDRMERSVRASALIPGSR